MRKICQKGFAGIIVLALVALAVVGFFGYRYFKSTNPLPVATGSPTPSISPGVTANWERHDFPKMGFSLALPAKWYVHNESPNNAGTPSDIGSYKSWISYPVDNPSEQSESVGGVIANISLATFENPSTSLDQDANNRLTMPRYWDTTPQKSESTLGGERSIVLRTDNITFVLADHKGLRFYLQLGTKDASLNQVFDQILSTFKFSN